MSDFKREHFRQESESDGEHAVRQPDEHAGPPRRRFLSSVSSGVMVAGLVAGYGTFVSYLGRFLFPSRRNTRIWQYVSTIDAMSVGASLPFQTPAGVKLVVARQSAGQTADSFIALSSICPHLGCAVHWESQNQRFFCPCHNGAFDASGKATEGPPAAANQELARFPLKVERGILYIELPTESVGRQEA